MYIVRDPSLSVDDKRSTLTNRAYDEHIFAERDRSWSRLQEIEEALQVLEGPKSPFGEVSQHA